METRVWGMSDAARWERLEADGARRPSPAAGPGEDVLAARRRAARWRRRFLVFVAGLLLSFAVHAGITWQLTSQGPGAASVANPLFDFMASYVEGGGEDGHRVTLIEFDGQSFADLGRPDAPPPGAVARLLQVAARGGARQIILNVDVDAGLRAPQTRGRLISALREASARTPVALAQGGGVEAAALLAPVMAAHRGLVWAFGEAALDADGVLRRAPLGFCGPDGGAPAPSLYWLAYERAGGAVDARTFARDCPDSAIAPEGLFQRFGPEMFLLHLADGAEGRLRRVSASVLLGPDGAALAADHFSGDTVIIGAGAAFGGERWRTPGGVMSSSMVIAHAILGWLETGGPLAPPPWWSQLLWSAAAAVSAYLLAQHRGGWAASRWRLVRGMMHPLIFEKLLLAGLFLGWTAFAGPLLQAGLWLTVLAGGYLAFLWYSVNEG